MPTVNDILADFDRLTEKRAAAAPRRDPAEQADDVVKLAERLVRNDQVKVAAPSRDEGSLIAKLASSLALTDTLLNLGTLSKIAEVEERARAAGASDATIDQFFEKNASSFQMVSVLQLMPWL
jgi:hypothetical protein